METSIFVNVAKSIPNIGNTSVNRYNILSSLFSNYKRLSFDLYIRKYGEVEHRKYPARFNFSSSGNLFLNISNLENDKYRYLIYSINPEDGIVLNEIYTISYGEYAGSSYEVIYDRTSSNNEEQIISELEDKQEQDRITRLEAQGKVAIAGAVAVGAVGILAGISYLANKLLK